METIRVVLGHFYSDTVESARQMANLFEEQGYEIAYENGTSTNFAVIQIIEQEIPEGRQDDYVDNEE